MSISLEDALRQVDLRPGCVYQCQVGQFRVQVRVDEMVPRLMPAPFEAADVMWEPWTDLSTPQSGRILQAKPGVPLLPDPPYVPVDFDT